MYIHLVVSPVPRIAREQGVRAAPAVHPARLFNEWPRGKLLLIPPPPEKVLAPETKKEEEEEEGLTEQRKESHFL